VAHHCASQPSVRPSPAPRCAWHVTAITAQSILSVETAPIIGTFKRAGQDRVTGIA
jgi:hypothetical protein